MDADPAPPRRGRRRAGEADARAAIVQAAAEEFAAAGYDGVSLRAVARRAGVDAALVHHYFGTKERVFAAAIEVSFEPALGARDVLAGDRDTIGERLARLFFGVWEDEHTRAPLLAVMRSALTNETAAGVMRTFVLRRLLQRIAEGLDVPDPTLRAELAASQMIGVALLRYVLGVEPLASVDAEEIVRRVAPTLQRHLTER